MRRFAPRTSISTEARAIDERILAHWSGGDHAAVVHLRQEYRRCHPEGLFGHNLMAGRSRSARVSGSADAVSGGDDSRRRQPTPSDRPPTRHGVPSDALDVARFVLLPQRMSNGTNNHVDHVVVLMLENRSFDHLFGFLEVPAGQKIDNLRGVHPVPSNRLDPSKPASSSNADIPATSPAPFAVHDTEGPPHDFASVNVQLCNDRTGPTAQHPATNDGFVRVYKDDLLKRTHVVDTPTVGEVMASFDPSQLPALNELARSFCLCDRWFCDVPSSTMCNRMFIHAATSEGYVHNAFKRPYSSKTVYELFEEKGLMWAAYFHDLNELTQFPKLSPTPEHFRRFEDRFSSDIQAGQLPTYSFIFPRFLNTQGKAANSQHAPQDIRHGENLIADVYDALVANPAVWNRTVLVVTYDEHGGFYDHVVPGAAPNPDGMTSPNPDDPNHAPHFAFDRLGLRVPTIIASPWIQRGTIEHRDLRHTSVIKTVRELFDLGGPLNLRDDGATSFADLFSVLDAPRPASDMPAKLPRPSGAPGSHSIVAGAPVPLADEPLDPLTAEWVAGFAALTHSHAHAALAAAAAPATHGQAAAFVEQRLKAMGK